MTDEELEIYYERERIRLEQRAKELWQKKIRWRIATHEEIKEYIEIMGLNPIPEIEEVPPQFCEFDSVADYLHWRVNTVISTLKHSIIKNTISKLYHR